jgi:hypothetical protein
MGWARAVLVTGGLLLGGLLLGVLLLTLGVPFGVVTPQGQGALAPGATEPGSYAWGISVVLGIVFAIFTGIAGLDLYFELRQWEPVGMRVQEWSIKNPWYVGALLVVLGALVAHFVGHPIS